MNEEEFMIVKDLDEFINASRRLVFNLFGSSSDEHDDIDLLSLHSEDEEELDSVLSYQECLIMAQDILKKQKNKRTNEIRYLVSESIYKEILEIFNSRLVSNLLGNLVNKGLIETAYDNESNDFVFWVKNNDKKQEEKPETD
jgi:hypothetical protein